MSNNIIFITYEFNSTLVIILLGIIFLIWKNLVPKKSKIYNWNLGIATPLGYDISVEKVNFFKDDKEIKRLTNSNLNQGWSGVNYERVLHAKIKEYLPDTVKLSWKEKNTDKAYLLNFAFPKKKVLEYWIKNQKLLKEKLGADYPEGQLSLKIGIAPDGLAVLWFSDMDINTSNFAIEIESYKAIEMKVDTRETSLTEAYVFRQKYRFGEPYFYPFLNKNAVNIHVEYYNGESNSINLKKDNNSVLTQVNTKRGWSFAKTITVSWFDTDNTGYKSIYNVEWSVLPIRKDYRTLRKTNFIYLMDRLKTTLENQEIMENSQVFELKETKREYIDKKR